MQQQHTFYLRRVVQTVHVNIFIRASEQRLLSGYLRCFQLLKLAAISSISRTKVRSSDLFI